MKKNRVFCYCICFSLLFTSGCWDRKELNDRAIWLASGWDSGKKGKIHFSGQIVVPANMQSQASGGGGGSTGDSYFTVAASGMNPEDAIQNLQEKLSREAFMGQRRVIFFGEKMAKRGVKENLDSIVRVSSVSIRAGTFVIKNGTAEEAFNIAYPLEKIPALTALKEYEQTAKGGDNVFLNFLIAANSDGIRPTLPAVVIGESHEGKQSEQGNSAKTSFKMAGTALFNKDLKLVGYLNMKESRYLYWITGKLKKHSVTVPFEKGNASLVIRKVDSKIIPKLNKQNKVKITVELTGTGALLENNTNLNLLNIKNVKLLEKKLEHEVKKEVLDLFNKVQSEKGTDVFGFGEAIHRKYPSEWKKMSKKWDHLFPEAEVAVKVNLTIKRVGLSGPPIVPLESETKK